MGSDEFNEDGFEAMITEDGEVFIADKENFDEGRIWIPPAVFEKIIAWYLGKEKEPS